MHKSLFIIFMYFAFWSGSTASAQTPDDHTVRSYLTAAKSGDPEAIAYGFAYNAALGREDWAPMESLAHDGYGEAVTKILGRRIWREHIAGATNLEPALIAEIQQAAQTIEIAEMRYILAIYQTTGRWHSHLLFSPDGHTLKQALAIDKPAEAILGCRLSATPSTIAAGLQGYCTQAAHQGLADAQYLLALQHHARPDDFSSDLADHISSRLKIPKSRHDAIRLYRAAADQGHAGAQARLASLIAAGAGLPQDFPEARRLAALGAQQGNPEAQAILGLLLLRGLGGDTQPTQGLNFLQQSARSGNRLAQFTLATVHMRGQMVQRDFTAALSWIYLSDFSQRGDPPRAEADPLLLEPLNRTREIAAAIGNAALDLNARIRAAQFRKELADSGEWPLIDPIPLAFPPQK